MTQPLWYLACPYSHPSALMREERFQRVNRFAAKLMEAGVFIFYAIAGHPGLWWLASAGDTTERVMATRGPGKNRGGAASFYRAEEVENIIHAALSKPEENQ